MKDEWFYRSLGSTFGPVPFDTLAEWARTQIVGPKDEVRRGENGPWMIADSIVGLFDSSADHSQSSHDDDTLEVALDISEFQVTGDRQAAARRRAPVAAPAPAEVRSTPKAEQDEFELSPSVAVRPAAAVPTRSGAPDSRQTRAASSERNGGVGRKRAPVSGASLGAEDDWYATAMGYDLGPMPLSKLVVLAQSGGLRVIDRVRAGRTSDWMTAGDVLELENAIDMGRMLSFAETVDSAPPASASDPRIPAASRAAAGPPVPAPSRPPAAAPSNRVVVVNGQNFVEVEIVLPGSGPQRVLMPLQMEPGTTPAAPPRSVISSPAALPSAPAAFPMAPTGGPPPAPVRPVAAAPAQVSPVSTFPGPVPQPATFGVPAAPPQETAPSDGGSPSRRESKADATERRSEKRPKKKRRVERTEDDEEPEDKWFCRIEGVEHGPVRWIDLERTAKAGRLKPDHFVRRSDEDDWRPASSEPELFETDEAESSFDLESLIGAGPSATSEPQAAVGSQGAGAAGPSRHVDDLIRSARVNAATAPPKSFAVEQPSLGEQFRENARWLVPLVVVGLGFAWYWFRPSGGGSGRADVALLKELHEEFKSLRNGRASDDDWKSLKARATAKTKHLQSDAELSDATEVMFLKAAVTKGLLKMFESAQRRPSSDEETFQSFLSKADAAIEQKANPNLQSAGDPSMTSPASPSPMP